MCAILVLEQHGRVTQRKGLSVRVTDIKQRGAGKLIREKEEGEERKKTD